MAGVWLALPLAGLLGLFFLAPLALLLAESFRLLVIGQPAPPGWTLANYVRFLGDPFYLGTLRATLVLGGAVTALAIALGYPVAYGLARGRHRWKTVLRLCVVAPLLVSVVIRTYGWIVLLAGNGVVNQTLLALHLVDEPVKFLFTHTGVTIGLVHFALPVAILSTADFDAATVNVESVTLGDPALPGAAAPIKSAVEDVNDDGLDDLLLHFSLRALVESDAIDSDSTQLMLTGETGDGKPIAGLDQVTIKP